MEKTELLSFLKENLRIVAGRKTGYISMGGPQDGDSESGEIFVELWFGEEKISSAVVENW